MSVDSLAAVAPPPASPLGIGPLELWEQLQARLGLPLPADWLDYGRRYGSGGFAGGLTVCNPLHPAAAEWVEYELGFDFGADFPHPMHPAVPGFLPWGEDDNGHHYGWLTVGPPDGWPVVFVPHGYEAEAERHPGPMTAFLARMFRGELPAVWQQPVSLPHRFALDLGRGVVCEGLGGQ
jgi:hypothetical protein